MKKRLYQIDLFRIIASIAVIVIHITAFIMASDIDGKGDMILFIINRLIVFAVPSFIFLSGFSLYNAYGSRDISIKRYIKSRGVKVLLPYLVWANIYFVIKVVLHGMDYSIGAYFKDLLLGRLYYHLYFIPIIIQFYIVFIPIKKLIDRYRFMVPLSVMFGMYIAYYFNIKNNMMYSDRFFMTYLPFFLLGIVMSAYAKSEGYKKRKAMAYTLIGLGLISAIIYIMANVLYYKYQEAMLLRIPLLWTIYCVFIIIALYIISDGVSRFFPKKALVGLSNLTMTVYFLHPIMILFANKVVGYLRVEYHLFQVIIKAAIVIVGSFFGAYVLAYISKWIKRHINNVDL